MSGKSVLSRGIQRLKEQEWPPYTGTIVFSFVLLLVFQMEYVLNMSFGIAFPLTPNTPLSTLDGSNSIVVFVLAPWMHVQPQHLIANLLLFIPVSVLYERSSPLRDYVITLLLYGLLINVWIPLLGNLIGYRYPIIIGISGVIYALASEELILQTQWLVTEDEHRTSIEILHLISAAVITGLGIYGVLRVPALSGVGNGHTIGLLTGAVFAIHELLLEGERN